MLTMFSSNSSVLPLVTNCVARLMGSGSGVVLAWQMRRANNTEGSVSGVRLVMGLTNATVRLRLCSARKRPRDTEVRPTLGCVAATKYVRMGSSALKICAVHHKWG